MLTRVVVLLVMASSLLLLGCAAHERSDAISSTALAPADIDMLCGDPWVGTLTYRDYQSGKDVTIDSSLIVRRVGDSPPAWEFGVGYSKEPCADAKSNQTLSAEGSMIGDERVVLREPLRGGGLRFTTERAGEDDGRPALFRFEHSLTRHEYSRRKLVRFDGEQMYFQRHIYRWKR